jgi:hypothetical protein
MKCYMVLFNEKENELFDYKVFLHLKDARAHLKQIIE